MSGARDEVLARIRTALSKGQTPGPEASIFKVVSAAKTQDLSDLARPVTAEAIFGQRDSAVPATT